MADLSTTYMGIPLANPIVVGSCSLSNKIDNIKLLEDAGAGALVIKSLFEEQVQIAENELDNYRTKYDDAFAEALSIFPKLENSGAKEHVYWIGKAREAVKMPLIASINCVNKGTWAEYACQLEETGVNGLELNFYSPALDPSTTAADVEKRELEIFAQVKDAVKIPVSVKLHPFYTSLMNVVANFEKAGADGFVLFNRLFQPDIDVDREVKEALMKLSEPNDGMMALRWAALLNERVKADIISSSGVDSGKEVAKRILVGAKAVQVVSVLYKEKVSRIREMQKELGAWMDAHKYANLAAFRGKLGRSKASDAWSFERGQYIKAIIGFD